MSFNTSFITSQCFPLVLQPAQKNLSLPQFVNLLHENEPFIKRELLKHGALLLRGGPVGGVDAFNTVIKNMNLGTYLDYIGGDSPRNKIKEGVYTSTEAPPSIRIGLHNELSYVKHYPSHIFFYCETPPAEKGETTLGDARKIFDAIDPGVRKRWMEKMLRYTSCYYYKSTFMNWINRFHKTWTNVFETDDKHEVERLCKEHDMAFKWFQNDWLQITQTCPATIRHPQTGESVWFNQAHHYDFNPKFLGWWRSLGTKILYCREHTKLHQVFFGDGSPIPRDELYHVMDVLEANTVYFPWQKGDVLVCDNILAMHGRATFTGKRRILVAMTGQPDKVEYLPCERVKEPCPQTALVEEESMSIPVPS